MQTLNKTVSYAPSAYVHALVYAVNPSAIYAQVNGIQIANTSTTTDYEVDVNWVDHSDRAVSSTVYHGDGVTVNYYRYDYTTSSMFDIINNGFIPAGASLSILDAPLTLQPNDFITVRPGDGAINKLMAMVSILECYDDGVDMSSIQELDYRLLNNWFQDARY